MSPILEQLVEQIAQYDQAEECWELLMPFPTTISVPLGPDQDATDLCLEWDEWCDENAVDYNSVDIEATKLSVRGGKIARVTRFTVAAALYNTTEGPRVEM